MAEGTIRFRFCTAWILDSWNVAIEPPGTVPDLDGNARK